jgi:ABC-type glutathione transport system ATPase component
MLNPGLIVADEPVSALDVSAAAHILNLFRDLNRRLGLALLFISHNMEVVNYLCDRVAVMRDGSISGISGRNKPEGALRLAETGVNAIESAFQTVSKVKKTCY